MAGRIPQVQQEVAPSGPRVSAPTLGNEADASQGVQALGQAAAQGAGLIERLQAEADTVRVTESLVDLERRTNERLLGKTLDPIDAAFEGRQRIDGFLQVQGTRALEASAEARKGLDEDLQEVSEKLLPRQRKLFLERALQLRASTDRRIEEHVVRESERAKVETLRDAKAEVLRSLGNDPRSSAWGIQSRMVDDAIRALAPSEKAAESAIKDWHGQVAIEQIGALLKDGDVEAAEQRYGETRDVLGDKRDDVGALIANAKKAKEKDTSAAEAVAEVQELLKESRPAGGYVIREAKAKMLEQVMKSTRNQEKVLGFAFQFLRAEEDRFEGDRGRHRNIAHQSKTLGSIPGATEQWLETFDAEWLDGFREQRLSRWRRSQALTGGTKAERSAAAKKQTQDDLILVRRYAAMPPEEQAKTAPEDFAAAWAAEHEGFSPSDAALAEAAKHQRSTIERLRSGDLAQELRFRADLQRDLPSVLLVGKGPGKGNPKPEVRAAMEAQGVEELDAVSFAIGNALIEYRNRRAEKGRDLTPDEEKQVLGEMKADAFEVVKEGMIFDSKVKVPGALKRRVSPPRESDLVLPGVSTEAPPKQKTPRQLAQEWLDANPNHPKAAAVRAKLGAMK